MPVAAVRRQRCAHDRGAGRLYQAAARQPRGAGAHRAAAGEAGLTPTQFGVLEALLHKGPLSQRELGQKVLTSAGNMTDLIDKLETRGLVPAHPPDSAIGGRCRSI